MSKIGSLTTRIDQVIVRSSTTQRHPCRPYHRSRWASTGSILRPPASKEAAEIHDGNEVGSPCMSGSRPARHNVPICVAQLMSVETALSPQIGE